MTSSASSGTGLYQVWQALKCIRANKFVAARLGYRIAQLTSQFGDGVFVVDQMPSSHRQGMRSRISSCTVDCERISSQLTQCGCGLSLLFRLCPCIKNGWEGGAGSLVLHDALDLDPTTLHTN